MKPAFLAAIDLFHPALQFVWQAGLRF